MDPYDVSTNSEDNDHFRSVFKYYKQRASSPSLHDVIDIKDLTSSDFTVTTHTLSVRGDHLGLKEPLQWKVHQFKPIPGFYLIPNPFTEEGKLKWVKCCMEEYSCGPHTNNVKPHNDNAWRQTCDIIESAPEEKLRRNKHQLKLLKTCPIWKLRWATLGLRYEWNSKVYLPTGCSEVPMQLNQLVGLFASSLGWKDFKSQAVFVNYYHVGSTIAPHVDESEHDLTRPLISISLGLSGIFLIGGKDKSTKPYAFLVRSGDVIIMSGPARLAYHSVPRIIECEEDHCRRDPIDVFTAHCRININARQFAS